MDRTPNIDDATSHLGTLSRFPARNSAIVQFLGASTIGGFLVLTLSILITGEVRDIGVLGAVVFYLVAVGYAVSRLRLDYPYAAIGLCNIVTVFRLALVSSLIAGLPGSVAQLSALWIVAVGALAFLLDGLDGWLARREGYTSEFGAAFDMEVDAVLALLLAFHACLGGNIGAYVILLGMPRYIFLAAQRPFPWLNGHLPERFSRKVVCVAQIAVLLVVLLPPITSPVSDALVGLVSLALLWSFLLDIQWLRRMQKS